MNSQESVEIENEKTNKRIAEQLGWTDVHGGLADGGLYLRGQPPGGKGLAQVVPNFLAMEAKGYFITNEADRPFDEHITKRNEDGGLNYIHPRLAHEPAFHNMRFPDATPVSDFGVLLLEMDGDLVGVVIGPSVAIYKHNRSAGKVRNWQGPHFFRFPLDSPPPESKLRWHKLTEIMAGGFVIEVMGATCIDGIGIIARWVRGEGEDWDVTAIDTESGDWCVMDTFDEDQTIIPPSPPTNWDDK